MERGQLDGALEDDGGEVLYAEWWQRAVAYTIDWVLVSVIGQILQVSIRADLAIALSLLFPFVYFGWANGELGQTLGKRILRLYVVDHVTGAKIGFARGLIRHFSFFALFVALVVPGVIDALFPLWDKKRQTLHDKVVRSVVVTVVRPYTEPA